MAAAVVADQLPGVLRNLEPILDSYGYLAVAGFVMLAVGIATWSDQQAPRWLATRVR